ncbi:hypothetical protein AMJ39_02110 [candidate division TA06 bacterium DG_24]|uniref:MurNAc-LAA domain-containing protein n=3 Tax=Bacteria division TA06 TaxID=1156500 RepID=A0A0S8JPC6_UNCT6|nr:MAG: hypothetical protein AMJ39_02110 [candidate division TA06 bacterium DG_24]KPK70059.1 MAG: hypothetical protein AMJ82_04155 [candidate division TA06 bacterium SM23_40]KPL11526.1 MAG: hypothetical protein AMJ71_00560 [candidate division TA06 bacterium SM1_40]
MKTEHATELSIVFPGEGDHLPCVPSTFVIGSAPPGANVVVNGLPARVHQDGGFIVSIPIEPGRFAISCTATLSGRRLEQTVTVQVAGKREPGPSEECWLDEGSVQPSTDRALRPGDRLTVTCRGTPGAGAHFTIEQLVDGAPMAEMPQGLPRPADSPPPFVFGADLSPFAEGEPGLYVGTYIIGPDDRVRDGRITVSLRGEKGSRAEAEARGRLTVTSPPIPELAETQSPQTVVRTGPGMGYGAILPSGVIVEITGKVGNECRVALSGTCQGWVDERSLTALPAGTPAVMNQIAAIRTTSTPEGAAVAIPMDRPYAVLVAERTDRRILHLTISRAVAHLDWARYGPEEHLVGEIIWQQVDPQTLEVELFLEEAIWGYRAAYEDPGFILHLRAAPPIDAARPLLGRKLAIDAGHSPEPGAVGPLGTLEKDVNLAIARSLDQMCRERGASTTMIRTGDEAVPLTRRPEIAREAGAEILVSIHNNSVPPGVDPERHNGFSTYYWHPHSLALARSIHGRFAGMLGLPDFGLYRANLAMCRPADMIAVLVEPAFMIVPEQEALLRTAEFQQRCARAVCEGLEAFLISELERTS